MPTERHSYRGFSLRLENGFTPRDAAMVVDRLLEEAGDRVQLVMPRPGLEAHPSGVPQEGAPPDAFTRIFVKGEFRRPHELLGRRWRASRAVAEGRGLRTLRAAGADVPRVLLFGEQSRLRPRSGSLLVTEKVRAPNAALAYRRGAGDDVGVRVAAALAGLHRLGFVHGDAVLRNFVPTPERVWIVDLPRWGHADTDAIVHDLARLTGSALQLGADTAHVEEMLRAYIDEPGSPADTLPDGWRERTLADAHEYHGRVAGRDANRTERHARLTRKLRFGERRRE